MAPLLVVATILAVVEIVARQTMEPTRLERILNILERDPALVWRLRSGLSTEFEGHHVRTNEHHVRGPSFAVPKPAGRLRVVAMGASPTFGWGVAEQYAYPVVMQRKLRLLAGLDVEVINGGTPGYTTWQGLRWLRSRVLAWSPDVVTVAYDLNDLDRFRFFNNDGRADEAQRPDSAFRVAAQNALNRSAAYRLLRRGLMGAASRRGAFDPEAMPRRVPLADYERNLIAINDVCREHGIDVVYLKMPINLPFDRLNVVDAAGAAEWAKKGATLLADGKFTEAREALLRSRDLDPTIVDTHRDLLESERRLGLKDEAVKTGDLIPFIAAFRDRADLDYNRAVEDVARRTGRPLVDAVAAFEADGRGDALWNSREDPFHPNRNGHHIVGWEAAQKLVEVFKARNEGP